jgi:hypothetical protein
MEKIRQSGVAIDDEEHEPGVVCVAASVSDSQRVVAAHQRFRPRNACGEDPDGAPAGAVLAAANDILVHLGRAAIPNNAALPRPQRGCVSPQDDGPQRQVVGSARFGRPPIGAGETMTPMGEA